MDRVATSADVKYAIERTLLPGVPNGYTANYLADVEGMKEAQAAVGEGRDGRTGHQRHRDAE